MANEAGAGKTYATFAWRFLTAEFRIKQHKAGTSTGPYYPTIFIVPSSLISQYVEEYLAAFNHLLKIKFYHGSPHTQNHKGQRAGAYLDRHPAKVEGWYMNFDSSNPETLKHVLITSYEVFPSRTLDTKSLEAAAAKSDPSQDSQMGIFVLKHLK